MQDIIKFCQSDENLFSFVLKEEQKNKIKMEIQEMFEFELDFQNLKISSSDDTLNEFIEKVNSKTYKNTTELLSQATKVYGDIFVEEEKPLYEGQDVFELDNDNNDIKFLERVRIKEEDFNSDLFLVVFEFLEPKNISILSRVSKKFYKLTNDQLLWKGICERNQIEITEEHKDNLKQNYIESLYSYFLDFESTTKTAIKPTTLYDFKQSAGHNIVIGTKITKGRHKWSVHYLKYVPKHDGNCYSVVGISNNTEATQIGCSLNT